MGIHWRDEGLFKGIVELLQKLWSSYAHLARSGLWRPLWFYLSVAKALGQSKNFLCRILKKPQKIVHCWMLSLPFQCRTEILKYLLSDTLSKRNLLYPSLWFIGEKCFFFFFINFWTSKRWMTYIPEVRSEWANCHKRNFWKHFDLEKRARADVNIHGHFTFKRLNHYFSEPLIL